MTWLLWFKIGCLVVTVVALIGTLVCLRISSRAYRQIREIQEARTTQQRGEGR